MCHGIEINLSSHSDKISKTSKSEIKQYRQTKIHVFWTYTALKQQGSFRVLHPVAPIESPVSAVIDSLAMPGYAPKMQYHTTKKKPSCIPFAI